MSALLTVAALAVASIGSAAAQEGCQSIVDAVGANGLTRLGQAVLDVAGDDGAALLASLATATDPLPEAEKVTIFAPLDAAWPPAEDLPQEKSAILNILLGHVVNGYKPSSAILSDLEGESEAALPTVAGTNVIASKVDQDVYVAAGGMDLPGAKVVTRDIETCAGVIHLIDKVLIASPDAMEDMGMMMGNDTCTPLVDAITNSGLSRLSNAVLSLADNNNATALLALAEDTMELPDEQKLTLFAPNNSAWPPLADLPTGDDLLAVLLAHFVPDYLPSADVLEALAMNDTVPLDTLDDMTMLNVTVEGMNIYVAAEGMMEPGAKVISNDIETCIGVIHVVDKILIADDALNTTMPTSPAEIDDTAAPSTRGTIPQPPTVTDSSSASNLVVGAFAAMAAAAALLA